MDHEKSSGYQYHFCVEGHIGADWIDWPSNIKIQQTFDHQGQRAVTLLTVTLPDQPALYGLLEKFRDLNLKLVYSQRDETVHQHPPIRSKGQ